MISFYRDPAFWLNVRFMENPLQTQMSGKFISKKVFVKHVGRRQDSCHPPFKFLVGKNEQINKSPIILIKNLIKTLIKMIKNRLQLPLS